MEKNKIQFKPLHEGMGFHPFSDGLPYAPESKARTSATAPTRSAAGASSAGRPRFQATPSTNPTLSTPLKTARQLQAPQVASRPVAAPVALRAKAVAQAPQKSSIPAPQSEPTPEVLLRTRFFAYLLDSVVHAGFWLATNIAALVLFHFQLDLTILKENTAQFALFFIFSQWIFIALQEVLFENSIGKSFFDLEFKRNHGSLFLRSIVFMVGILSFGLGLRYRPQDRFGEIQLRQSPETSGL